MIRGEGRMRLFQKTVLIPYLELFTLLDRFCPMCGAPLSVKVFKKMEFLACTQVKCPYYQPFKVKEVRVAQVAQAG